MLRVLAFFLAATAIISGVLGLIMIASGALAANTSDIVVGAAMIVLPALGYAALRWYAWQRGRRAFDAVLQDGFAADGQNWFDGCGVAISTTRSQILVAVPGAQRVYPASEMRAVYSIVTGDVYGPGGIAVHADGMLAGLVSIIAFGRVILAYFTDGMFIDFSDGTRWRIVGVRKADARAWEQRFADAGLPLAA
ncbi:MAG: hypothetical protein EOP22_14000 [Hyphomicrobiales bacterium]|nr:MAG: hypothetical protein EOP22_14000 [Hyphomicrobiales bacterium]